MDPTGTKIITHNADGTTTTRPIIKSALDSVRDANGKTVLVRDVPGVVRESAGNSMLAQTPTRLQVQTSTIAPTSVPVPRSTRPLGTITSTRVPQETPTETPSRVRPPRQTIEPTIEPRI